MRTHRTRRTIPWALAAALLLAAGCGDDDNDDSGEGSPTDDAAAAETTAADSDYCDVAIEWAIHELTPFDDSDPIALEQYWQEHTDFEDQALASMPEELKADWELKTAAEDETIDVVLEKYGYDVNAIMEQGTPEEQAAFEAPPDAAAAQDRIIAYESEVCGSAQPLAADVSYDGEEPGPYCELVVALDERAGEALATGDTAEVEAVFDDMDDTAAAFTDAAPDVIREDVVAVAAWNTGRQRDAAERYGYDLREAMREGSPQDRLDINHADPEIRDQFARVAAYEEQVCYG